MAKDVIANDTEFLNDLAKDRSEFHSNEFDDALEGIYKLLGGDPADRRDFLAINCLLQRHGDKNRGRKVGKQL
jgi:hypothetical protein